VRRRPILCGINNNVAVARARPLPQSGGRAGERAVGRLIHSRKWEDV
jgi:hypothetical protein